MKESEAKKAEDILKKYDKESDTMEYTGLMAKIVAAIAIAFSVFQLYTATGCPAAARRPSGIWPGAGLSAVSDLQVVVAP